MQLQVISPLRDDVRALIAQLDQSMADRYPAESNHFDAIEVLAQSNVHFLGLFEDEFLVAVGAVKKMDDDDIYGEIKRVFVSPNYRGQGLAKTIMDTLESHLMRNDIPLARLETGIFQPEAIGLYEKLGYCHRGPYGVYPSDPMSVFMEKQITQ